MPPRCPRESARKPLRSLVILSVVAGLVVAVASARLRGVAPDAAEAQTLQQVAADDAQSLVVASDAAPAALTREQLRRDDRGRDRQEEGRRSARPLVRARALASRRRLVNINLVSPGTGEVRWPILIFTKGRGLWDSGYHQGVDLLAAAGTPIYAAAAGVVSVSQESYGGYGVAVTIEHVIGGQRVSTLYGHMTYGSRQVVSGQTVEAGQLIGLVGSTGSSTRQPPALRGPRQRLRRRPVGLAAVQRRLIFRRRHAIACSRSPAPVLMCVR